MCYMYEHVITICTLYYYIYTNIYTIYMCYYNSRSAFESFLEGMEVHVSRKSWNQMFKKIDRYERV